MELQPQLVANWHVTEACNYRCKFEERAVPFLVVGSIPAFSFYIVRFGPCVIPRIGRNPDLRCVSVRIWANSLNRTFKLQDGP